MHDSSAVRMRQYVLSLPMTLRFLLARRRELQGDVLGLFLHAVFELLRRKAYEHGLCDHGDDAKPGSVSVLQRFGSSLELNVHFHCLVTDGVFIDLHDGNQPEFYALPAPTQSELESIAWSTCRRVVAQLERAGLWPDDVETAGLFVNDDDDGLNDTYTASICGVIRYGPNAGRRICRVFGEAARPQYQATKESLPGRVLMLKRVEWLVAKTEPDCCVLQATCCDHPSVESAFLLVMMGR